MSGIGKEAGGEVGNGRKAEYKGGKGHGGKE